MPNRIIKESICESMGLSECSIFAGDLYKRLITYADDYGRFNADTKIMLARLYPRELDCVTEQDLCDALIELSGVNKVAFYTSTPRKLVYGCFPNWSEHQRVRDSKSKCPDPDDTEINDWYLQRFIPIDLKIEIIERDGFKCCECKKFVTSDMDARRLIKRAGGTFHIDHIVPVAQGGRATSENLRLLCPSCNLKRKRKFSFAEILEFAKTGGESQRSAANCGLNPIQSESNPNPNPNPNTNTKRATARDVFLDFAGENESLREALKAFEAMRTKIKAPLTDRGKKTLLTSLKALSLDPDTQVRIIDQSTTNCWKGFFALKENKMNPRGPVTRTAVDEMGPLERRMVEKFKKNSGPLQKTEDELFP